ncbi:MAG TPA: RNA polymerase sigma factor [Polyangiaceae bacterium]|nr:RNA polymerase sigma factor [Polyangiaceae bacterium]
MSLASPPTAESDLALMSLVARQDARAQRVLVERLSERVRRIARLLSGTSVDPDDAAQLALLEILRSAASFRVATNLERWADRISARTTLRLVRREHQRRSLLTRWLVPGALPWGKRDEANQGERIGLDSILARLSPPRREALVLRHALEFSIEEIAELTGAPEGTVKDRLVAARKQMRRLLERDIPERRSG